MSAAIAPYICPAHGVWSISCPCPPGTDGKPLPPGWNLSLAEFRRAHPATRCFQRYNHEARADMRASHRLGHRQREASGEFFYTHPGAPDRAFPTHGAAVRAAHLRAVRAALEAGADVPMHVLNDYAEAPL